MCRVTWPEFCADPWSAADRLHDAGCIKRSKSYLYFHMLDQYHCLTAANGSWAVDFIGRVDEPNEDWSEARIPVLACTVLACFHACVCVCVCLPPPCRCPLTQRDLNRQRPACSHFPLHAQVVRELNARRVPDVPALPAGPLEQKNVRAGNVRDPYANPDAEVCFDAVSRWYGCDVQTLGFAQLRGGKGAT
jgi:hypothetical protein